MRLSIYMEPHLCRKAGSNHSIGILTFSNSTYYISRNENKTVTLQTDCKIINVISI